jgi:hypothetical protein
MDRSHVAALDAHRAFLDSCNPAPSRDTKSKSICAYAKKLNGYLPAPTPQEVNDYLRSANLPEICQ